MSSRDEPRSNRLLTAFFMKSILYRLLHIHFARSMGNLRILRNSIYVVANVDHKIKERRRTQCSFPFWLYIDIDSEDFGLLFKWVHLIYTIQLLCMMPSVRLPTLMRFITCMSTYKRQVFPLINVCTRVHATLIFVMYRILQIVYQIWEI